MLDVVQVAEDALRCPGMPSSVLAGLGRWIPCDLVSFCDLDLVSEHTLLDQEFPESGPTPVTDEALDRFWWATFWRNRFCSFPERPGDRVSVTRLSDFYGYGARELRGVLGYQEFFHDADVVHELMVCLPTGPGRTQRLLFTRGRGSRDFTERDRWILALLRPHLQAAWLAVEHARQGVADLTPREWLVLALAAEGRSNFEIASSLFVSPATVRKHLEHVFDKLGVRSRSAAAALVFPQQLYGNAKVRSVLVPKDQYTRPPASAGPSSRTRSVDDCAVAACHSDSPSVSRNAPSRFFDEA